MAHVWTYVPHLDLVDFGQNVFATARPKMTSDLAKKNSNQLMLWPHNPYIHRNVGCFCPGHFFFHFDITYP